EMLDSPLMRMPPSGIEGTHTSDAREAGRTVWPAGSRVVRWSLRRFSRAATGNTDRFSRLRECRERRVRGSNRRAVVADRAPSSSAEMAAVLRELVAFPVPPQARRRHRKASVDRAGSVRPWGRKADARVDRVAAARRSVLV